MRPFGWLPPLRQHVSAWPMLCWSMETLAEAAAQCREILNSEPDAIEAIVMLGAALVAEGQVDEAISHLNEP